MTESKSVVLPLHHEAFIKPEHQCRGAGTYMTAQSLGNPEISSSGSFFKFKISFLSKILSTIAHVTVSSHKTVPTFSENHQVPRCEAFDTPSSSECVSFANHPTNNKMNRKTNIITAIALSALPQFAIAETVSEITSPAPSNNGDWCSMLKSKPTLYKNSENPFIQEIGVEGRLQYQAAHISGSDVNGNDFNESFDEYRRARIGTNIKFLNYFGAKYQVNVVSDGRPSRRELDWGYDGLDEAYVSFDLGKAIGDNYFDSINLKYGYHKFLLGHEATESSKKILTPERSAISNKVYQSARLTGLMGYAEKNDWTFGAGIYSSSQDAGSNESFSGWQDGQVYWLHAAYEATDKLTLATDMVYNDVDRLGGDDDSLGYDWAVSISGDYEDGRFGMITDFIFGDNGDQSRAAREGSFYGIMAMPYYWLVEDKLQGVVQVQHMAASDPEGVRINSRYGRRAESYGITDLNGGRGDSHQSVYAGLNYYICDHNAKFMGGVEYQQMDTPKGDFDTLTYVLAFRSYF